MPYYQGFCNSKFDATSKGVVNCGKISPPERQNHVAPTSISNLSPIKRTEEWAPKTIEKTSIEIFIDKRVTDWENNFCMLPKWAVKAAEF